MYSEFGVSTVLVVGGSGDYLDVADTVIAMETFRPHDVTARAAGVASDHPTGRIIEENSRFDVNVERRPRSGSVDPSKGRRESSIRTRGIQTIQFGRETLDLAAVEQIVHWAQTRAIGSALDYARRRYIDGRRSLSEILDLVMADIEAEGIGCAGAAPDRGVRPVSTPRTGGGIQPTALIQNVRKEKHDAISSGSCRRVGGRVR